MGTGMNAYQMQNKLQHYKNERPSKIEPFDPFLLDQHVCYKMRALVLMVLHDQKTMFPTKGHLVFIRFKSSTKTQPTYKSMCTRLVWECNFLIEMQFARALKHSLLVVEILTSIIYICIIGISFLWWKI